MYYVFHGDDEFSLSEALTRLKDRMGDPEMVDINTTALNGRTVDLSELIHACDAVPFLGERRLVVVERMLERFDPRKGGRSEADQVLLDGLRDYLGHLPDTTRLIFVETKTLHGNNPILRQAQRASDAYVEEFGVPNPRTIAGWITHRVKGKGAEIQSGAAVALSAYAGDDLRLLDQEIEKLLTYTNRRPITEADVRRLVPAATESDIFAMVDALGQRKGDAALMRLHELLEAGESPIYLLYMITRQFRILTQVKELLRQGVPAPTVASRLSLHPFVAKKAQAQAKNFSLEQLANAYRRILGADEAIKTGKLDAELALDLLVADLAEA
jgi:DNA polymerase-3 subunit delta